MNEPQAKILDAFLDEMLNDDRPKRSSGDILRNVQSVQKTLGYSVAAPEFEVADESKEARTKVTPAPAKTPGFNWSPIFATAAALAVIAAISFFVLQKDRVDNPGERVANNPGNTQPVTPGDRITQNPPIDRTNPELPGEQPNQPGVENPEQPPAIVKRDEVPENPDALVLPPEFKRETTTQVAAASPLDAARNINQRLFESWESRDLEPAKVLDLRNWANRLASRMVGRTLTASELTEANSLLVQAKSPELVRIDLIEFFMDSPTFRSEFNEHWGQVLAWQMLGISPSRNTSDTDMVRTRQVLVDAIAGDQPLDKVAYQLISAVGSTAPTQEDFNPASSYLVGLNKRFGTREPATAHIAKTFLGNNSQCAQCHNSYGAGDSVADSSQKEYFEFHSFFAQMNFERTGSQQQEFQVFNRNFLPLGNQGNVEAAYKYKDPAGTEFEVFPRYGQFAPDTNGFVAKVDRRTEIARVIAGSKQFREAMVEHVWTSMLNLPLSGIDGQIDPKLAEMKTQLGEQFAANNFELPWLVSTIAASNAFAVGVGTEDQLAENNPFLGKSPQFNVFYSRLENRRSAIKSLNIVAQAYSSGDVEKAMSAGLLARVNKTTEARKPKFILPFVPTKESQWATSPQVSKQLDMIAASDMSVDQKLQHIIQAALGRPASPDEVAPARIIMEKSEDQRIALQDVWWSLLNSIDYKIPLNVR